jgi:hypothetical protein
MVRTNSAVRCFCAAKCMLDAQPDPGAGGIGFGLLFGEPAARWAAELDPIRQAAPLQHVQIACGAIGSIRPDAAGGVPGIQESRKAAAVMLGRISDRPAADQPMPPVDADRLL